MPLIIVFVFVVGYLIGDVLAYNKGKRKGRQKAVKELGEKHRKEVLALTAQIEELQEEIPSDQLLSTLVATTELINPELEKELLGLQKIRARTRN